MSRKWENQNYRNYRRRRRRLMLISLLLVAIVASAFWLLRRGVPGAIVAPAVKKAQSRSVFVLQSIPSETAKPTEKMLNAVAPESLVADDDSGQKLSEAQQAADTLFVAGKFSEALKAYNRLARLGRWSEAITELQAAVSAQPNDFTTRKLLAQALYRQNELELALEQVQVGLALQTDDELLDLQAKLQKEMHVQRNYQDARTTNFIVLFDGYEHEEMKYIVLDILKSAYAEIGKKLDYFPGQPISVILYTAKDFSDVTSSPMWVGGMFGKLDGKIRVPVQGAAGNERALHRVLFHEYTHALLYALAPNCPLWLQEGLAQYFCGDKPVNVGQVIPLPLLVNGFPSESRAAFAAYMESLQVVYDLVEEHGMSRLHQLLDKLSSGSDLETAFAVAYGQPFSRWAAQWRPLQRKE